MHGWTCVMTPVYTVHRQTPVNDEPDLTRKQLRLRSIQRWLAAWTEAQVLVGMMLCLREHEHRSARRWTNIQLIRFKSGSFYFLLECIEYVTITEFRGSAGSVNFAPGQGRTGQGRAGQGRAGQGRAGQGRAGQSRAGRAGQGRAGQGRAGQGRAGQGRAGQGRGRAGQGRAGQGRAGQDYIQDILIYLTIGRAYHLVFLINDVRFFFRFWEERHSAPLAPLTKKARGTAAPLVPMVPASLLTHMPNSATWFTAIPWKATDEFNSLTSYTRHNGWF